MTTKSRPLTEVRERRRITRRPSRYVQLSVILIDSTSLCNPPTTLITSTSISLDFILCCLFPPFPYTTLDKVLVLSFPVFVCTTSSFLVQQSLLKTKSLCYNSSYHSSNCLCTLSKLPFSYSSTYRTRDTQTEPTEKKEEGDEKESV